MLFALRLLGSVALSVGILSAAAAVDLVKGGKPVATIVADSKPIPVAEGKALQFRWEAFNSLNHVNLSNPSGSGLQYGTSNFGRITSAGSARTMQLGLKFNF